MRFLLGLSLCIVPSWAFAACATPVADAGAVVYSQSANAVQFCNGTKWINTGRSVPAATGTSCSSPSEAEGSAVYNSTQNTIQFCNGDNWVNMGTAKYPSATGVACASPAGPEGSLIYNNALKRLQFCNGDGWINATAYPPNHIEEIELVKLKAQTPGDDARLGHSVSIDGDYIVSSEPRDAGNGTHSGAVIVYKRAGNDWNFVQKLAASNGNAGDKLGDEVSISGDYLIAGSMLEDTGAADAGMVYVFKNTAGTWAEVQQLQPSDSMIYDYFGKNVSISGDYLIAGAYTKDTGGTNTGAAYFFKNTAGTWAQDVKVQASDKANEDFFGNDVHISGNYAIVGAFKKDENGTESGAAYIFKNIAGTWTEIKKITPSDGQAGDFFGYSVAIDGEYAVVGGHLEDENGVDAGAVYIFKNNSDTWTQVKKLKPQTPKAGIEYGWSVDIDGGQIVVGAYNEDAGGRGALYVYEENGGSWSPEIRLEASDRGWGDFLGTSVSIDAGVIASGAKFDDDTESNSGAVYVFE